MLGPPKPRRLDEPIPISLDALVPADNFYRHLEARLDLGFVRDWVQELYAGRGRPSIDSAVFIKLQLVMFFEGIRSERKLVETASLHLVHRWYLGYALDEPLPDWGSRRPAFFGQDDFAYDPAADAYRCPAGHPLRRAKAKREQGVVVYRGDPATCNACSLKPTCTESDRGRTIHRSVYAAYLEKVCTYHATEAYKKAMRTRQVWIEPLFAEAKGCHGLRSFRLRGLANVNIEGPFWLAATFS